MKVKIYNKLQKKKKKVYTLEIDIILFVIN
jgi:hypothetical protein